MATSEGDSPAADAPPEAELLQQLAPTLDALETVRVGTEREIKARALVRVRDS